ncbi:hypothetical protein [Streptomyces sp. NPDC058694]|uniref:hypothetical protein n=1 Tax=Streptomyces sp. NPDC058694 TaxID=3346603 RepID=UPI00365EF04D
MPQQNSAPARPCPHCKGFAIVAITTGIRYVDGNRETVNVSCPACRGRGHAPAWVAAPTSARAGR